MKSLLAPILSSAQCAKCRFCCSFAAFEAWEAPLFTSESVRHLTDVYGPFPVKKSGSVYTLDFSAYYASHGQKAYAPCPFLDGTSGCILSDSDKPFDCKIWPLRIMHKGSSTVIALTPTCPEINALPIENVRRFAAGGTGDLIYAESRRMPDMIKQYREGFPVLMEKADDKI